MLTGYQTPAALRRLGRTRLEAWLRRRSVRAAARLAATAIEAADAQHTTVPGEQATARVIADLANEVANLNQRIVQLETTIAQCFAKKTTMTSRLVV